MCVGPRRRRRQRRRKDDGSKRMVPVGLLCDCACGCVCVCVRRVRIKRSSQSDSSHQTCYSKCDRRNLSMVYTSAEFGLTVLTQCNCASTDSVQVTKFVQVRANACVHGLFNCGCSNWQAARARPCTHNRVHNACNAYAQCARFFLAPIPLGIGPRTSASVSSNRRDNATNYYGIVWHSILLLYDTSYSLFSVIHN